MGDHRTVDVFLGATQWVVGKALAPVADGVLKAWAASRNLGPNMEDLGRELLCVKATLEQAALKELSGRAIEPLQELQHPAHGADILLEELHYFRIQAANEAAAARKHAKLLSCCAWQPKRGHSSSAPQTKLGTAKLPHSPHPHVGDDNNHGDAQRIQKFEFNRDHFIQRMRDIVQQLQLIRNALNEILQCCGPKTKDKNSPRFSTPQSAEPKLFGRDRVMNCIIHDITKGQYYDEGLTVLPIIGPGGIGKTALIQHIYNSQQVRNHFSVRTWICVSFSFNLGKVLEQIKIHTLPVEGEHGRGTTDELIEHRLRHKRFLLVLDDVWQISNWDDWRDLLSTLSKSQEQGCVILVMTRFHAIADMVTATNQSIELNGLEHEEFQKLFLDYAFGYEEEGGRAHDVLLETGDKIMQKLKGSPLAAKTVGRLLRGNHSLQHWRRVLERKEWEMQTSYNDIMPTLKLSYDFLPFHLQQCFVYSALFPEDYRFRSRELISLWIGLDILIPGGQNQTLEDIGLRNLNELVIHEFFREEETDGDLRYVMHDLLHELALQIASHDCLTLHHSNVGSVEVQPFIRHLSIIIDDDSAASGENFKTVLTELKTKLNVEDLQTLMLFGEVDESFANIFGGLFRNAKALRVLHLHEMSYPVEYILPNFSTLIHLRYLFLLTKVRKLKHRYSLSLKELKFVRVLDLYGYKDLDNSAMDDICLMTQLKYLSLKETQVTEIPREISKLQRLKTLAIRTAPITTIPPEIGQLQNLETLDVSRTQISSLPREISGLQNLETLDVSQTQISSLPREISGLQNLETLDVSRTQISNLPAEISILQKLETLDVRHTLVKELPKEVLQLLKLKHLHFGQSGCFGVKLPVGIDQMKSVQVMGTVYSRECSKSAVKEISELIPKEVNELEVVLYDGPNDMDRNDGTKSTNDRDQNDGPNDMDRNGGTKSTNDRDRNDGPNDMDRNDGPNDIDRNDGLNDKKWNDKLLSSVGKCSKLKSLTIYGDSNPSDELSPKSPPGSPYFPQLEKLKVAGRFVKVPGWIGQLHTLTFLVIRVWKLEEKYLKIIGGLPSLSVLELALVALPRKQVTINSSAGFAKLEVFCFDCRVPWVSFQEKAMPKLKQLQLKLYSGPGGKLPSGIMLLERLNMVTLMYSSQYEGSAGVTNTVDVVKRDAARHANLIELSINGKREIFPSNRSADRGVAGTESDTSGSRVITEAEIEEVVAFE